MPLPKRESPKGKRVSLFVTCMVDMLHPQTGISVVQVRMLIFLLGKLAAGNQPITLAIITKPKSLPKIS